MCGGGGGGVFFSLYVPSRLFSRRPDLIALEDMSGDTAAAAVAAAVRQFKILSTWETGRVCAGRPFRAHVFFRLFYDDVFFFLYYMYMRGNVLRSLCIRYGGKRCTIPYIK